jgi:hypothetical protein
MLKAHWTPRYVAARARQEIDRVLNPEAPRIPASARAWLERSLTGVERGIEWGSGRSTVWLASRVASLVSVEESPAWYERVGAMLTSAGTTNVHLVLAHVKDVDGDDGSEEARARRQKYLLPESNLGEGAFQFALVDGCLRAHCSLQATRLISPGGLLVLDDSHRYLPGGPRLPGGCGTGFPSELWETFARHVAGWEEIHFTDGVGRLTVWRRPVAAPLAVMAGTLER